MSLLCGRCICNYICKPLGLVLNSLLCFVVRLFCFVYLNRLRVVYISGFPQLAIVCRIYVVVMTLMAHRCFLDFPLLLNISFLSAVFSVPIPSAVASAKSFYCGQSAGAPATLARTASGKSVPVIRWSSTTFNTSGWDQSRRCQVVSSRFEQFRQQGTLQYLTTGRMNGQSVICTTLRNGGGCEGLLYTLKPGQNPTKTLADLLDVRTKASGPLNETTSRLYVKMSDVLDAKSGIKTESSSSFEMVKPSPDALW